MRRATPDEVGAWLEGTRPDRAQLDVGELALAPGGRLRVGGAIGVARGEVEAIQLK